jgi:hypothetical protein
MIMMMIIIPNGDNNCSCKSSRKLGTWTAKWFRPHRSNGGNDDDDDDDDKDDDDDDDNDDDT